MVIDCCGMNAIDMSGAKVRPLANTAPPVTTMITTEA